MSTFRNLLSKTSSVPGFVGGWKAYGRSNSEDPATREILPDYSGNGRDIRLYNFSFSGMSGWGGYNYDFAEFIITTGDASNYIQGNIIHIGAHNNTANVRYPVSPNQTVNIKVKVDGVSACVANGDIDFLNFYCISGTNKTIKEDGSYDISVTVSDTSSYFYIYAQKQGMGSEWTPLSTPITIEQLPMYPGGLVSDGVDDYGQCVKGFALPDDYTVVAVRKMLTSSDTAPFVAKSGSANNGAFIMEYNKETLCYSYGEDTRITNNVPILFSYQMKSRYNGITINEGSSIDSDSDILMLFRLREGVSSYNSYVLYDLRIYDHSLTAEELQLVKDEMMADYEKNAKPLEGITYVADWDAKGRSNDEDADVRDKWIDKATGKVINLSNFSFSEMSGWNGYQFNWSIWQSDIEGSGGTVILTQTSIRMTNTGTQPSWTIAYLSNPGAFSEFRIKVTGLKAGTILKFSAPSAGGVLFMTNTDGIFTIPAVDTGASNINFAAGGYSANESTDLLIEQLPLYPGALVCDGIDDYGQSAEAISEEIGTALAICEPDDDIRAGSYFFNCGNNENANELCCWLPSDGIPKMGLPSRNITLPIGVLTRTPASPSAVMSIASYSTGSPSKIALYRLILIQEQLDDAAVEFLRWKVEKEYRDWCKANGYEYAINQLTE